MTIFLFSDKKYEPQSIACIEALKLKINESVRIIYYTIGFKTDFKFKNLIAEEYIPSQEFYKFNFIKPELCLYTMKNYTDDYYLYLDIDFFLSKKVDLNIFKHNENYPLASYGPVEFPCIYDCVGGNVYTESTLMKYFGVESRTMRYVWNCIFSFNNSCLDFIEEWESICKNQYLLNKGEKIFPSQDETAFNVCLWKRNAVKNYGFGFLNTASVEKLIFSEENNLSNFCFNECLDCNNYDWECIHNSNEILGYHAFKDIDDMKKCVEYLTEDVKKIKTCVVVDCYPNNDYKLDILRKNILSLKKLKFDILIVSHLSLPKDIIESVDYYIYDKDNCLNEINFTTTYFDTRNYFDIFIQALADEKIKSHEFAIVKSIKNALNLLSSLDYDYFIFSEYDNIYNDEDIKKIQLNLYSMFSKNKNYVFWGEENFCETIFFLGKTKSVLNYINNFFPNTVEEYNLKFTYEYPYGLELFFYRIYQLYKDYGLFINTRFSKYFNEDEKNISRIGSVEPHILKSNNDRYYLCLINFENIEYTIEVYFDNEKIYFNKLKNNYEIAGELKNNANIFIKIYCDQHFVKDYNLFFDLSKTDKYNKKGLITFK